MEKMKINAKKLIVGKIKIIESEIAEHNYILKTISEDLTKKEEQDKKNKEYALLILKEIYVYLDKDGKTEEEIINGDHKHFLAVCEDCSWVGDSNGLDGGRQIADTGDYDDVYCPNCGSSNIDEI